MNSGFRASFGTDKPVFSLLLGYLTERVLYDTRWPRFLLRNQPISKITATTIESRVETFVNSDPFRKICPNTAPKIDHGSSNMNA
jgi:hypothetical protein